MQELCGDEEVAEAVQQQLVTVGRSAGLKGFEIPKRVHLTTEPFTVENDLMTPSFKLKRPQLKKRYDDDIRAMYSTLGMSAKL
jgi:long-chain acyl-CoA synthetase